MEAENNIATQYNGMLDAQTLTITEKSKFLDSIGIKTVPFSRVKKMPKGHNWEEARRFVIKDEDNIGILCKDAGIIVIDLDLQGPEIEQHAELNKLHDALFNTFPADFIDAPSERTPTGGYHFFFKYAEGGFDKNSSSILTLVDENGLELKKLPIDSRSPCNGSRSNGGCCVIAPSRYVGPAEGDDKSAWKKRFTGDRYREINQFTGGNLRPMSPELMHMLTTGIVKYVIKDDEFYFESVQTRQAANVVEKIDNSGDEWERQRNEINKRANEIECEGLHRTTEAMRAICERLQDYPAEFADNAGWQAMAEALVCAFSRTVEENEFIELAQLAMDPNNNYREFNTTRLLSYLADPKGDRVATLVNALKRIMGDEFRAFMMIMSDRGLWDLPKAAKSSMTFSSIEDITKLIKMKSCRMVDVVAFIQSCIRCSVNKGKFVFMLKTASSKSGYFWNQLTKREFAPFCEMFKPAVQFENIDDDGKKTIAVKNMRIDKIARMQSVLESITIKGTEFLPYAPNSEVRASEGFLNLYCGIRADTLNRAGFDPESPNEYVDLFKSHIREIWCKGDAELSEHILRWFAHIIQRPNIKTGVAIVVVGVEGSGKSIIPNEIIRSRLLGENVAHHYESIGRYTERFESKREKLLLAILNEANTSGINKADRDLLKHRITDDNTEIEHKGQDKYDVKLYNNIIITTNNYTGLMIGPDDRHYIVLETSSDRVDDYEYFKRLAQPSDNDILALHYYLAHLDLTDFHPNRKVKTAAKHDMALNQLNAVQRMFMAWLTCDLISQFDMARDEASNSYYFTPNAAFTYYKDQFCSDQGITKPASVNAFKRDLKTIFGEPARLSKENRVIVHKLTAAELEQCLTKSLGVDLFLHIDTGNRPWPVDEQNNEPGKAVK